MLDLSTCPYYYISLSENTRKKNKTGNKLKTGQSTRRGCKSQSIVWVSGTTPERDLDSPGTSDWKKMKVSGTKNLFFVCSHSLRHLTNSNGAVGRPFLSSQHILLGHLHFLQCRSRSLVSRDPAVLYLHHLHRCSEDQSSGWFQSVPVTRTSCPSFKAEIICALSLLNRCSCKSGTY